MSKPKLSAKDYLSQAYRIDQRINSKLEQVMKLRESVTKATATLSDIGAPDDAGRGRACTWDSIPRMRGNG